MALIHRQPYNRVLRTLVYPFRKLIPEKYYFAIDGEITFDLTNGKKMHFTGNPTSNLLRLLFWYGYKGFEPKEYNVFVKIAQSSKCLVDVGANLGYYSILAKIFNPGLKVYGFEPLPGVNKYYRKNLALNQLNDVQVSSVALSDTKGNARFFANRNPRFPELEDHLFGDNSLDENFPHKAYDQIEIQVETDTLDNFVTTQFKPGQMVDFLKMDTEGSENLVLRGAKKVLAEHRPVIMCEVVQGFVESEIQQIIRDSGYKMFRLTQSGLREVQSITEHAGKEDFFFIHPEKTDQFKQLFK